MMHGKPAAPPPRVVAALILCIAGMPGIDAMSAEIDEVVIIGLIMDDLGNHADGGRRVASLPGPIACSVLPHTPHATRVARLCNEYGKVVMLHLPMQPVANGMIAGPGLLHEGMNRIEVVGALRAGLDSVPFTRGINNHMGSHLTRHLVFMQWVMEDIATQGGIFFVDSLTSVSSVALKVAQANGVPAIERDVFLDNDPRPQQVREQFERLIATARRDGYALGIGHPYPATLNLLEAELPDLPAIGIMLVSIEDLVRRANGVVDDGEESWQAHLYHSPADSRK